MRAIVFVCASALLAAAPAWAQQDTKAAPVSASARAAHPAHATHKSLNPIGQALDSLLRETGRAPSQSPAHDTAAGSTPAAAPAHEADIRANGQPAPVEIAVH